MRILIIGGTGFIGTHLCEQLCKKNAVTVISKYRNQFSNEANNVVYYYEDWRAFDYDVFFANNIFDKIILVGWSGHPRLSNNHPFEHFETNVTPNTAAKLNSKPYGKTVGIWKNPALATAPKFTIPIAQATT